MKSALAGLALSLASCRGGLVLPPSCEKFKMRGARRIIDAHCHIFNGTDLQVAGFVTQVKMQQPDTSPLRVIGDLLQAWVWAKAPTAKAELAWLRSHNRSELPVAKPGIVPSALAMDSTVQAMGRDSDQQFVEFWAYLRDRHPGQFQAFIDQATAQYVPESGFAASALRQPDAMASALTSADGIRAWLETEQRQLGAGTAIVTFVKTFFRYRTENAWTMLQMYGCDTTPGVDMLCASLVDYDLWLGDPNKEGGRTRSPIEDQIELMRELTIATRGRVQCLIPFNPLRAACDQPYMDSMTGHLKTSGCLGVKLYPATGFSVSGNAGHASGPLPACGKGGTIERVDPNALDEVLVRFFSACSDEDVPVMTHASPSNGNATYPGAEKLGSPAFFEPLLGSYAKQFTSGTSRLRINLGHMGGNLKPEDLESKRWRREIAEMMSRFPGRVYADLGFYDDVLGEGDQRRRLAEELRFLKDPDGAPVRHTMYGSDWSMLAAKPKAPEYLRQFSNFLESELDLGPEQVQAVLGGNAATFYGLEEGGGGLARLQRLLGRRESAFESRIQ